MGAVAKTDGGEKKKNSEIGSGNGGRNCGGT